MCLTASTLVRCPLKYECVNVCDEDRPCLLCVIAFNFYNADFLSLWNVNC